MSRRASSEEILDEVERNLTGKFNLSPEKASRRLNHMRSAFPNAVVKDYEDLIPAMTNDPKDRHVAAAAVRGGAALIVTANIRDFPPESLEQYDIEAVHPDDFLQDQFDLDPTVTVACLRQEPGLDELAPVDHLVTGALGADHWRVSLAAATA